LNLKKDILCVCLNVVFVFLVQRSWVYYFPFFCVNFLKHFLIPYLNIAQKQTKCVCVYIFCSALEQLSQSNEPFVSCRTLKLAQWFTRVAANREVSETQIWQMQICVLKLKDCQQQKLAEKHKRPSRVT